VTGLWPHQELAVKSAVAHLADDGRCQVIAACGTGKTRIGAEASRQLAADGKVLVVLPGLVLLAQTARDWAGYLREAAGVIGAVCSESVREIGVAEIQPLTEDLHAGVTRDPDELAAWLRAPGRLTVFSTFQSLPVSVEAARRRGVPGWDLIVIDEAHRSAGRVERAWSAVHDDEQVPARRRLYMTATPRLMGTDKYEAVSMDDPAVFGPEAFRLTFAEAIEAGLLADYRVAVTAVTEPEVARLVEAGTNVSAGGQAVPAQMLAAQVALLKACRQYGLQRVITFHRRVASAQRFAGTLLNAADLLAAGERPPLIRAEAVDGDMTLSQRRHLDAPGNRTVVVSNARVLTEGVDVPELDGVMFADPRDSATDVVQAVGRALRRGSQDAKTATIIIPVLLNHDGEPEESAGGAGIRHRVAGDAGAAGTRRTARRLAR
jgi:predicted helicase